MLDYSQVEADGKKCCIWGLEESYHLGIIATLSVDFRSMLMGKSFENYHGLEDGIMFAHYRSVDVSSKGCRITLNEKTIQ